MVNPSFLVVGGGSIGERHLRCLKKAGYKTLYLIEPRREQRRDLSKKYSLHGTWASLKRADLSRFTHAIVATPPVQHWAQTKLLASRGIHVLVEKPLCISEREADAFVKFAKRAPVKIRVAYNFRCAQIMREAKKRIQKNKIGRVQIFQAISGQYFPEFRPDYLKIYWADAKQGGCSLDALSHSVDLAMWFLGPLTWVGGLASRLGLKKAPVDDSASLILKGRRGEQVVIAVNLFQKQNEARFVWIGEKGSLMVENPGARLCVFKNAAGWKGESRETQRDDAYILQAKLFVRETMGSFEGLCSVPEAAQNLKWCVNVRRTFRSGR